MKIFYALILAGLALSLSFFNGLADGFIYPEPPICPQPGCQPPCPAPGVCPPIPIRQILAVRYHHVTVTITDQVAVTRVEQVFYNPNSYQVEGTYLFPLPKDAAVSSFTMWVDGQAVEAQILDAKEARQKYEQIVATLRDPALLEYIDQGAVQASLFPIPAGGERKISLEYSQTLAAENGLVHFVYPLNTEKFSSLPIDSVSVDVTIRDSAPIRAVYSPSHAIETNRQDDQGVRVSYEANNVRPETDFSLFYSLGETQAFHLLTYRDGSDPTDKDGYFLLLLAPQPETPMVAAAKDVILVLDRSGSMEGEKFQQAQQALGYILRRLNSEDRFNILAFSSDLQAYAGELRPANEAAEARAWVDGLSASGSTDINRALLEASAIADKERPTYLIFLTDGLPTVGEQDRERILANVDQAASNNIRLFSFGVGYDVDTFLLDTLSQEHHGLSSYVEPGQRLDEILSGFYSRISTPVLTDLSLDFGSLPVYDMYPNPLPDLFAGSQIILLGRYREAGFTDVSVSGMVNGERQRFEYPRQEFPSGKGSSGGNRQISEIPRLWATRKVGYLLNQVRLEGPSQELIDQIVKLSIRYGIVTPYTSYLVDEQAPLGAEAQDRIVAEQYDQLLAAPAAMASGQEAVQKSAGQAAIAGANAVPTSQQTVQERVKSVGGATFVWNQDAWIDTRYDPQTDKPVQVAFLSEDYFDLVEARPELAAAFALGERVIAQADGVFYEVVSASQNVAPVEIPPALTTPLQGVDSPGIVEGTPPASQDAKPGKEFPNCLAGLLLGALLAGVVLARTNFGKR